MHDDLEKGVENLVILQQALQMHGQTIALLSDSYRHAERECPSMNGAMTNGTFQFDSPFELMLRLRFYTGLAPRHADLRPSPWPVRAFFVSEVAARYRPAFGLGTHSSVGALP